MMINKIDLLISANDKLSMQESGVFFLLFLITYWKNNVIFRFLHLWYHLMVSNDPLGWVHFETDNVITSKLVKKFSEYIPRNIK